MENQLIESENKSIQLIYKIIERNPQKYNEFIQRLNNYKLPKNIDSNRLLFYCLIYNSIALDKICFDAIKVEYRPVFLNRWSDINRKSICLLLKTGKERYEKAKNKDAIINLPVTEQQEIDNINTFLSNNGDKKIYTALDNYINRGVIHVFDGLSEKDIKDSINNSLKSEEFYGLDINFIKDEMFRRIHMISMDLGSKKVKRFLNYFNSATPIEEIEYKCIYKPFFLALLDYRDRSIKPHPVLYAIIDELAIVK